MANGHPRLGHQGLHVGEEALDGAHAVVEDVDLALSGQLPLDGVPQKGVGVFQHIGLHRIPLLRWGFQQGHVADTHHGHVQGARDGRGGKREHVHALLELFELLLVFDAEALLLVHHQQPKVLKAQVLAQQAVGADEDVDIALCQLFQDDLLFLGAAKAGEHLHPHREARKALLHGFQVLLGQDGGGHQHGHLFGIHHGLEGGAHGHLRLSKHAI